MDTQFRLTSPSGNKFIASPDSTSSIENTYKVVDTPLEKTVLTALLAIDVLSYISPFRWLPHLAKCGGDAEAPDGGTENENNLTACLKDTDCREPRVCEGGQCVYPSEDPQDNSTESDQVDAGNGNLPENCKVGDWRSCGPCDIGLQQCASDNLWSSICNYAENQLQRACYNGHASTKGVGLCADGTQNCLGDTWGECNEAVLPHPETCDGLDNDCDGQIDEGEDGSPLLQEFYPGDPETLGHGLCASGWQYCNNGHLEPVAGREPTLPQPEICDDVDNDCDGSFNEDVCGSKIGDPCYQSSDCDSNWCIAQDIYPGGYCTDRRAEGWNGIIYDSSDVGECLPGTDFRRAVCVGPSELSGWSGWVGAGSPSFCLVTCNTDDECRQQEGYQCKQIIDGAFKVCIPANEEVHQALWRDGDEVYIPECAQ